MRELSPLTTSPIVGAPLAGGPSTPALAAAVCEGGGLGFLAAGYKASSAVAARLRGAGIAVWCTVTSAAEATVAIVAGVNALVVQGAEAGGHQSSFTDTDDAPTALVPLLRLVRSVTDAPLIAAGGIATS